MNLRQLEYFVRVAELGSFTRASIELDVAQPALSRQVRMLEVELRQNLFLRTGRGVSPTEAGKLLLEHARGILHQVERAHEELARIRGARAGQVALGLPPSLSKLLTVSLTREFRARMPEASLSITEGLSATLRESLLTGRLDMALLYNAAPHPDLDITSLSQESLYLVERRLDRPGARPVPLREVAARPLVIPSRPNAIRMLVENGLAAIGCRPNVALEIDGIPAILDLVADGAGCAVLPRYAVTTSGNASAYSVRTIVRPRLRSRLYLAVSSKRPATLTQQAMFDQVRETVASLSQLR